MDTVAKRLASGSAMKVVTLILGVATSFFMMPFVIGHIGDRWYGLWVLSASILGFYGALDLGLSSATQRYIAYHIDDEEPSQLLKVFNNSLFLFTLIGIAALTITLIVVFLSPIFWHASKNDITTFQVVIVILGFAFGTSFPFYVLNGILTANYRYDIASYIQISKLALRTAMIVYAVLNNYGIIGMAVATIIADFLGHFATLFVSRKLAPWIKINFSLVSKQGIRQLFSYSIHSFVIFIAHKIKNGLDNLLISAIIGLSMVTPYNIALQLTKYLNDVIASTVSVSFPLFTRKYSQQDSSSILRTFSSLTRITSAISISLTAPTIVFGPNFIATWMGPNYESAFLPLQILAFSLMLASFQAPALQIFYSHAKHNILAKINLFEAAFNLFLSYILISKFGIQGAAYGTAIPLLFVRYILFPLYVPNILGMDRTKYWLLILKPTLLSFIILIFTFMLKKYLMVIKGYLMIFSVAGSVAVLCLLLLTVLLLNSSDRTIMRSLLLRSKTRQQS